MLDYDALDLKPFYAGALVRYDGSFHRVADPLRHPADGVLSLFNPVRSASMQMGIAALHWVIFHQPVGH